MEFVVGAILLVSIVCIAGLWISNIRMTNRVLKQLQDERAEHPEWNWN